MSDGPLLRLDEAASRIAERVVPIDEVENVGLHDARGRVLARDLFAPTDSPAHSTAAMDGYAYRHDAAGDAATPLRVIGRALAGRSFGSRVEAGQCIRIMTGATLPDGTDTVVAQEDTIVVESEIRISASSFAGRHVRQVGEHLRRGDRVLPRGRRLRAFDLGLAASTGVARLEVIRRLRVCVFSTGNELCDAGDAPVDGAIHDSNRPALIATLEGLGATVVDGGVVRDDPAMLEAAIERALDSQVDAIVTSGGVAGGDADHVRAVLDRLGHVDFWKLAIKPGRPMAFGTVGPKLRSALLFALPGNPVAALVAFQALVRDALLAAMGATPEPALTMRAAIDSAWPKQKGRTEFLRAVATRDGDAWRLRPTGHQGSGALRSMTEANCLIVLEHERGPIAAGDLVEAWPLTLFD